MKNKSDAKIKILIICCVFLFSFFAGYYLSYRLNSDKKSKLEIVQEIMSNEWYYGIDEENIEEIIETNMILGAIDQKKDSHTKYLQSLGPLADNSTGVGITASIYGKYFIIEKIDSVYALEDGLKVGDIITKVNDIDVENKSLKELNNIITASAENTIKLTILRDDVVLDIYTGVKEYAPITVWGKNYENTGYLKITQFNLDTAQYVKSYLSTNTHKKLIIDLRGNPGGYIRAVRDVMDLFLTSDKLVMSTVDKHGNVEEFRTIDDNLYVFEKIVVLIDGQSASGAEAMAAALNYHLGDIVTLYGQTTYGKGSAQKTYVFDDGTYFHYTYALWNTAEGITINHVGVKPEVEKINKGISSYTLEGAEKKLYNYGNDVGVMQIILKNEGLYSGEVHLFMDEETVAALQQFQENHGLNVTGRIDMNTIRYMVKLMYDDEINYLNNQLVEVLESM